MVQRPETSLHAPISWWLHESLNNIDSESYWRARLILSASGIVAALALFSLSLQNSRGANASAVIGFVVLAMVSVAPLILRYSGSVGMAANCLTAVLFLGLTTVNIASAGHAPGAELGLVLVVLISFLSPGQVWPSFWGGLVCVEILAIPHLESLGFPIWIEQDPATARDAIHRVPVILTAAILSGGLITNRISRIGVRKRREAELQLELLNAEKERLEKTMLERQQNLAAVGTLAASVAHQINNPVGAILAAAQFAWSAREDDDRESIANEALANIEREARRCGRIVHSLLRISSGGPGEKWESDVHAVVNGAFNSVLPYARERSASLRLELGAVSPRALVCPIEIEQVVVNLLRNGIESSDSAALVVVTTSVAEDRVRIEIRDNGRGIPDADAHRVFEPFYTTRSDSGGTGLGLSVVRGIVEDHGGEIHAYPVTDGEGTVFAIELPILTCQSV